VFTNRLYSFVSGKCDRDISLLLMTQTAINVSKYQLMIVYMVHLRRTSVAFELTGLLKRRVHVVVPQAASEAITNC
jgi:hypothetical protein